MEAKLLVNSDGIIGNKLSVALFASHALLVEGETEAAVLYGIGDRAGLGFLESRGLSIVPAGGKGGIPTRPCHSRKPRNSNVCDL